MGSLSVTILERTLAKSDNITIESPKILTDKVTGAPREHDVVLTIKPGHHEIVTAIECRDRSRKVTVNEVEAFHTKCNDTGVNQGIIVATRSFTKSARKKAMFHGIRCLDLESAAQFPWLGRGEVQTFSMSVENATFTVFTDPLSTQPVGDFEILDETGALVSSEVLKSNVEKYMQPLANGLSEGTYRRGLQFASPGYKIREIATQTVQNLARIDVFFDIVLRTTSVPFDLVTYRDKYKQEVITQGALAHLVFEGLTGDLVLTQKPGEGTEIKFVIASIDHQAMKHPPGTPITVFSPSPQSPPAP
jgi:hypothetical protein